MTDLDQVPEAQHADEQSREDEAGGVAHLPCRCAHALNGHLQTCNSSSGKVDLAYIIGSCILVSMIFCSCCYLCQPCQKVDAVLLSH